MDNAVTAALTHQGLVREANEDSSLILGPEQGPWDAVLIVADGMGGHVGGKQASSMAAQRVADYLTKRAHPEAHGGELDWSDQLVAAYDYANTQVRKAVPGGSGTSVPGSTLTTALLSGSQLYVAQVGDSRAYLLHGASAQQVSEDQTWIAEQVKAGKLTEEEALRSPFRGQLSQAMGIKATVTPVVTRTLVAPGEIVLLCTDGLHDYYLAPDSIAEVFEHATSLEAGLQGLAQGALAGGGEDNLTAVAARVGGTRTAADTVPGLNVRQAAATVVIPVAARHKPRSRQGVWAVALIVVGVLALAVASWLLLARRSESRGLAPPTAVNTGGNALAPSGAVSEGTAAPHAPEGGEPSAFSPQPEPGVGAYIELRVETTTAGHLVLTTEDERVTLQAGPADKSGLVRRSKSVSWALPREMAKHLVDQTVYLTLARSDNAIESQRFTGTVTAWTLAPDVRYRVQLSRDKQAPEGFWIMASRKPATTVPAR